MNRTANASGACRVATRSAWPRPASSASRPRAGSRRWPPTRPADPQRRQVVHPALDDRRPEPDSTPSTPSRATPTAATFKAIETAVPGIRISEHLPKLARQMKDIADHPLDEHEGGRPRPGDVQPAHRLPAAGPIQYPTPRARSWPRSWARTTPSCRASSASRPYRAFNPAAFGPGFLGPQYAPLVVGERGAVGPSEPRRRRSRSFQVEDLDPPPGVDTQRADARLGLLDGAAAATSVEPSRDRAR